MFTDVGGRAGRFLQQGRDLEAVADRRLDGPAEDVRLCVSGLASNALVHGSEPGHGFLVRLAIDDDFVSRVPCRRQPETQTL